MPFICHVCSNTGFNRFTDKPDGPVSYCPCEYGERLNPSKRKVITPIEVGLNSEGRIVTKSAALGAEYKGEGSVPDMDVYARYEFVGGSPQNLPRIDGLALPAEAYIGEKL